MRKTFSNPLAIREINFHYVISEALEDQIHFSFRLHNSFFYQDLLVSKFFVFITVIIV